MDALERGTIERTGRTSHEERARQVLELMRTGYRLKRAGLRARHPTESEEQIEQRFHRWLAGDDRA